MKGGKAVLKDYIPLDRKRYLNLGSGGPETAKHILAYGKTVIDIDFQRAHDFEHHNYTWIKYDLNNGVPYKDDIDVIVANHVLEHIQNTGLFLSGCATALKDDGTLCIAVPPFKHNIVGGHVHVWNLGLLMYNLALNGFDVVSGRFKREGYNLIGIVKKMEKKLPDLQNDNGDIEKLVLLNYLPKSFYQAMNGDFNQYNWK